MRKLPTLLKNKLFTLLALLVALLPFSYYPLINFGKTEGMHIDISLLYIVLVIFCIGVAGAVLKRQALGALRSLPYPIIGAGLLVIWMFISIFWSPNLVRGAATSAFFALLVSMLIAWWYLAKPSLIQLTHLKKILSVSLLIACLFALWQFFGDALGIDPLFTLLPETYRSQVFGFARPTAFSLEPQFFASLLIAPLLYLFYRSLNSAPRWQIPSLLIGVTAIFTITLSRGALYAFGISLFVVLILQTAPFRQKIVSLGLLCAGVILGFLLIFSAASLNNRDTVSGYDAVAKSVNQLSLGVFSIEEEANATSTTAPSSTSGYVEESTNSRLSMSEQAINLWQRNLSTLFFGVGIGGFGTTLHAITPSHSTSSIVNNYYLETLVELGIVGILLLASIFATLFVLLYRARNWIEMSILVAFCIQMLFFSGNANIVHIWVYIGFLIAILGGKVSPRLLSSAIIKK